MASAYYFFRNVYWYSVLVGFIATLYTVEFIEWYKPILDDVSERSDRANLFMLGVMVYWVVSFLIPIGITKAIILLLNKRRKMVLHSKNNVV